MNTNATISVWLSHLALRWLTLKIEEDGCSINSTTLVYSELTSYIYGDEQEGNLPERKIPRIMNNREGEIHMTGMTGKERKCPSHRKEKKRKKPSRVTNRNGKCQDNKGTHRDNE